MCTFRRVLLVGLALMPLTWLQAQETTPRRPLRQNREARTENRTEVRTGQTAQGSGQLDRHFVSCLRSDNKGEVAIATLGSQKATNPDVKAFAQQMVKDHNEFLAKLDKFDQSGASRSTSATTRESTTTTTGRQVSAKSDSPNRDAASKDDTAPKDVDATKRVGERRDNATNPPARADVRTDVNRTETTTTVAGGDIAHQMSQIKQEITEKCVASAQKELNSKEGAEFDRCFIGMQIGAHMHMVDALSVLSTHASPELQQILDEGLQTSQQHLEHAKQIAKKLEGASSATGERASPGKTDRNKEKEN